MPYLTPDPADFNEVCRVLVIPAGYAAVVMGALSELTMPYRWEEVGDSVEDAVEKMRVMIDNAYETECSSMAETPREVMFLWWQGVVNAGNALQLNIAASEVLNTWWRQNTAAINDEMKFTAMLEEGTYDLTVLYRKSTAGGIQHWIIDGAEDAQTIDTYATSGTLNNETTISVAIVGSGQHEIKCKMSSKNASSSNYENAVSMFKMVRTGD